MKKIADISKLDLPLNVLQDVNKRINDWLSMGGNEEDPYIQRQIEYAEMVANSEVKSWK